jgi:hypothetical protein
LLAIYNASPRHTRPFFVPLVIVARPASICDHRRAQESFARFHCSNRVSSINVVVAVTLHGVRRTDPIGASVVVAPFAPGTAAALRAEKNENFKNSKYLMSHGEQRDSARILRTIERKLVMLPRTHSLKPARSVARNARAKMRHPTVACAIPILCWSMATISPPPRRAVCEKLQFRLVNKDASRSTRRLHLIHSDSVYALEDSVIITAADFARVEVGRHEDDMLTDVIATPKSAGAASLHRATAAHVERHIAVQIGDSLSLVAVIASGTDEIIALAMGLGRSEADELRDRFERARICEQAR